MHRWWEGASAETGTKKAGDAWAFEHFGMTIKRRISTGECRGAKSAEEALTILVSKIGYSDSVVNALQQVAMNKTQELPRVSSEYNTLHQAFVSYAETGGVQSLMQAQAAVWRMVAMVPPKQREKHTPALVRLLAAMGLRDDAMALYTTIKEA
jgi:hypothetical protein